MCECTRPKMHISTGARNHLTSHIASNVCVNVSIHTYTLRAWIARTYCPFTHSIFVALLFFCFGVCLTRARLESLTHSLSHLSLCVNLWDISITWPSINQPANQIEARIVDFMLSSFPSHLVICGIYKHIWINVTTIL